MSTMLPDLTDVETIKQVLAKRGIRMSRSLGQNFLICREVVETLAEVASAAQLPVVELGPGLGAITQAMLGAGLEVRAIEKDDDFAEMLPASVPATWRERLEVVHGDLKDEEWAMPEPYQVIGNIPYNLTGLIIRRVTQLEPAPQQVILLMQKEVGERVRAVVPEMNLLSLAVSLWGRAELLMQVPPHCFWPQPDVASQLLLLQPDKKVSVEEREAVMSVARVAFGQKRKQLQGSLRKGLELSEEVVTEALEAAHVRGEMRPEEVSPEQWRNLARRLPLPKKA